jgi:hypothetical protein
MSWLLGIERFDVVMAACIQRFDVMAAFGIEHFAVVTAAWYRTLRCRHGGLVSKTLVARDRAAPTCASFGASYVMDQDEMEEFRQLEPWNRPNIVVSKITALVEHHRRMGNLGERACLDVFRDCQVGRRKCKTEQLTA